MDNIGNDITLIQRFDDLYLETSDRYRLTPRNTVHWRRPNALFIPILVETFARVLSSPFSSSIKIVSRKTSEDKEDDNVSFHTFVPRTSRAIRVREFFTRPQQFRLFEKALVEETQHEIDQLGDTHDDDDGILKSLLRDASPFLFPCTIEFSLICAVILFEMWKRADERIDAKGETPARSSYHLSIDCSSSHRSASKKFN